MRIPLKLFTLCALAVLATSQAGAQGSRPVELGIDAGVGFKLDKPHRTTIGIPAQSLRAGFYISDKTSFEPTLSLNSVSGSGQTITTYSAAVGMLWHFRSNRGIGSGFYARPFLGFSGVSGLGVDDTQAEIGTGLGLKIPFVNHLATRIEANYKHSFASGNNDSGNWIGLSFGLSFFTK